MKGPEQGMGIREERGSPKGREQGMEGLVERGRPKKGAGAGWESGGKGKPPRKKKRILKGEVKNLGNLPIKKVRTSMMEGKEGELSCE